MRLKAVFPVVVLLFAAAGILFAAPGLRWSTSLDTIVSTGGRRGWAFEASVAVNLLTPFGKMEDGDWFMFFGTPKVPFSYTESAATCSGSPPPLPGSRYSPRGAGESAAWPSATVSSTCTRTSTGTTAECTMICCQLLLGTVSLSCIPNRVLDSC